MKFVLTLDDATAEEAIEALVLEFNRQLTNIKEESVRARTNREAAWFGGRIFELNSIIEFLRDIVVEERLNT